MRKVKICMDIQCSDRVNMANAVVCKGCGRNLRNVKMEFLDESEIEKRLNPPAAEENPDVESCENNQAEAPKLIVVCPSCNAQLPYQIGMEFCECGEYIADETPITLGQDQAGVANDGVANGSAAVGGNPWVSPLGVQSGVSQIPYAGVQPGAQMAGNVCVSGMTSLDGACNLSFCQDYMEFGREGVGREYFLQYGKQKVSRSHIIIRRIENAWYLSYKKKPNGGENAVCVNGRVLAREEEYRLQYGDEISLGSNDRMDPYAAFFRVQ